jgi:hypothetical protein
MSIINEIDRFLPFLVTLLKGVPLRKTILADSAKFNNLITN